MGTRRFLQSGFFSLLAHLAWVVIWAHLVDLRLAQNQKRKWISLTTRAEKRLDLIQERKNRIVQTQSGVLAQRPKKNAFLGLKNQVVHSESVGQVISSENPKKFIQNIKRNRKKTVENRNLRLSQLGIPLLALPSSKEADHPQWASPEAFPQDTWKGIKQSDYTALNTREYLFYGYFQRIRSRLDQAWVPLLREKLSRYYLRGRHLAREVEHMTQVLVVLNDHGEIVRVHLLGESGTQDLDDAAVEAFNQAGPFPNPPIGMIDHNREVQIPWNFILKT